MFPITADIGDISPNKFLNSMTTNGILQLYKASIHYYESKQGTVDIIKETGYGENISQAFKDFTENAEVREDNFLENIKYQTKYDNNLEKNPPHVVLVMVESFGLPIIKYQSDSFDIMGSLKKHFEEDILFTNFISGGNGTADSLESLLLNFIQIPNSVSYGQSLYSQVSFEEAAAKVYQKMGYETTFVYGGDLSWRNVGNFISNQGFDHCIGKSSILKALNLKDDDTTSHPWGVFDELTYKHVNSLLKIAKKPQFIFVLTTNNHPPYVIPKTYKGNSLTIDDNLKKHLNGGEYSHKDR